MDMIQQVVKTEKEQEALLSSTEAQLEEKSRAKKLALQTKFLEEKEALLAAHATELAALKKKFQAKQKRHSSPSYSLTSAQKKTVVADILTHIKWQLKK
jgi:hypothetical protein